MRALAGALSCIATGSGAIGLPTAQAAKLQQQSAQAAAYKYKYKYKLYL